MYIRMQERVQDAQTPQTHNIICLIIENKHT